MVLKWMMEHESFLESSFLSGLVNYQFIHPDGQLNCGVTHCVIIKNRVLCFGGHGHSTFIPPVSQFIIPKQNRSWNHDLSKKKKKKRYVKFIQSYKYHALKLRNCFSKAKVMFGRDSFRNCFRSCHRLICFDGSTVFRLIGCSLYGICTRSTGILSHQ